MRPLFCALLSACLVLPAYGSDRVIRQTVDTTTARVQPAAIGFFRGESVSYVVTPRLGSAAITVSTNATATWTVCPQTNVLYTVLTLAGSVATNGVCTFYSPVASNVMAAGAYDSFVRIQDGATLVTASRSTLNVYKSPYSEAVTVLPYSFAEPAWVAASNHVVYTTQMGFGSTWNGAQWTFGAGSVDLSFTNLYYLTSNPSNYCTLAAAGALTNGLVVTNDSRLTDARTPVAHSQPAASITNAPWALTNSTAFAPAVTNIMRVTGSVSPDCTGYYIQSGPTTYWRLDGAVSLSLVMGTWIIHPVGASEDWESATQEGTYSPAGGASGDAVVSYYRGYQPMGNYLVPADTNDLITASTSSNITAGLIAPYTNHQDRVDNPHGVTADLVGALSTNGGALNGAVTTVRSNGWAGNELITADGVRGFMASGKALYMTTNVFAASWQPTNTTTIGAYEPTAYSTRFSVGISSANQYIATMVDTNPIPAGTEIVGPATVVINIFTPSGAQTSLSVKPEIYYTYNLNATSLTLGDFDAAAQAITVGQTNAYTWSIAFASVVPTSTYYRVYRLKTTAKGNNTTTASIGMGGAIDSYVLYQQGADTLGARGATNIVTGAANGYDSTTRTLTYAGLTNVTTDAIVQAGAVTGTPWKVDATNIATSVHAFYQTNYIALYTTTNDGYGEAKIIIDGNLGDRFFWDGASQSITNDIAGRIAIDPTNGVDMQGIVICFKQGDPAFELTAQGLGFSLDFPGTFGNLFSSTPAGGIDYMGLRKRPLSNIWDIQGWQKGFAQ